VYNRLRYSCSRFSKERSKGRAKNPSKERAHFEIERLILALKLSTGRIVASTIISALWIAIASPVLAQQVDPVIRADFLENPLTSENRDPLLPALSVDREYSPLERQMIARDLDQLAQAAQQLLEAGQISEAFALWRRELKLRRVLGPQQEFAAIQRVTSIAWNRQRITDVQLLTLRTREIWDTIQASLGVASTDAKAPDEASSDAPEESLVSGAPTADLATLNELAQTFVTLRDIDSSVEVYQQLIALSPEEDGTKQLQQLTLAALHLEWFHFAEATNLYLTLLNQAKAQGDIAQERVYLEQLAYSYQQADALLNANRAQTDLLELYRAMGEEEKFPEVMVAIAQNYRQLNLHTSAIDYYRAAYREAQRFEQFSFSAQVLNDLGSLYESLALTEDALGTYSLLIPVEQQAYNDYGIMNAHDKIGQLQRRQGNDLEALKAFERALVIADRLSLREAYFIEQIEAVSQR